MLDKWSTTDKKSGQRYFITNDTDLATGHVEDLAPVGSDDRDEIEAAVEEYYKHSVTSSLRGDSKYFKVQDVALRKNAGTGSLGTSRWVRAGVVVNTPYRISPGLTPTGAPG